MVVIVCTMYYTLYFYPSVNLPVVTVLVLFLLLLLFYRIRRTHADSLIVDRKRPVFSFVFQSDTLLFWFNVYFCEYLFRNFVVFVWLSEETCNVTIKTYGSRLWIIIPSRHLFMARRHIFISNGPKCIWLKTWWFFILAFRSR